MEKESLRGSWLELLVGSGMVEVMVCLSVILVVARLRSNCLVDRWFELIYSLLCSLMCSSM